jgi:hypothetical protein
VRPGADDREVLRRHPRVREAHDGAGSPAATRREGPPAAEQAALGVDGADGARVDGLDAAEAVAAQEDAGHRATARVAHLHRVLGLPLHRPPRQSLPHHQVPAPASCCCMGGSAGGGGGENEEDEEEQVLCSWLCHGISEEAEDLLAVTGLAMYGLEEEKNEALAI